MWLLRFISLPFLRYQLGRTVLTVVGIATGVACVTATGGVTDSVLRSFDRATQATMGSATLRVTNSGAGLPEVLLDRLSAIRGVEHLGPIVEGFVVAGRHDQELLKIFGLDLVGDARWRERVAGVIVEIPDELKFVNDPRSIALSSAFASSAGYVIGDELSVRTGQGPSTLHIRGLVSLGAGTSLFGSRVAVVDVAAAQQLLGRQGKFDHVDVWLDGTVPEAKVVTDLDRVVSGFGRVETSAVATARAKQLLFAVRVFLTMAASIAVIVGLFIVYHTVYASIHQRRRYVALLQALGVSRSNMWGWLMAEAAMLGIISTALGLVLGVAFAELSLSTFGSVTLAWVPTVPSQLSVSATTQLLAVAIGIMMPLLATALSVRSLSYTPTARLISGLKPHVTTKSPLMLSISTAIAGFIVAGILIYHAPRTLPYTPLVAYLLLVNGLVLVSFGLLAPPVAVIIGNVIARLAGRLRGLSLLIAGTNISRDASSFTIVVTAIVGGLASALATLSLTASLKTSATTWMEEHYLGDLIVTTHGSFLRFLTAPSISPAIAQELSALSGIARVQGIRAIEVQYDGAPIVLLATDDSPDELTLYDAAWNIVRDDFWAGRGILVSDNLARLRGVHRGDQVSLETPSGLRQWPVLGTFPDYTGGAQLGSVALSRKTYRQIWHDDSLSRIRVWADSNVSVNDLSLTIHDRFSSSYGLEAIPLATAKAAWNELIDNAFRVMHALVAVSLVVSFVAAINFLLTAVADRRFEIDVLRAAGVHPRDIATAIVVEGGLVGVVGVLLGILAGIAASRIIVLHSVPMVTGWLFTYYFPLIGSSAIALSTLVLSVFAGLPPGLAATRREIRHGQ